MCVFETTLSLKNHKGFCFFFPSCNPRKPPLWLPFDKILLYLSYWLIDYSGTVPPSSSSVFFNPRLIPASPLTLHLILSVTYHIPQSRESFSGLSETLKQREIHVFLSLRLLTLIYRLCTQQLFHPDPNFTPGYKSHLGGAPV